MKNPTDVIFVCCYYPLAIDPEDGKYLSDRVGDIASYGVDVMIKEKFNDSVGMYIDGIPDNIDDEIRRIVLEVEEEFNQDAYDDGDDIRIWSCGVRKEYVPVDVTRQVIKNDNDIKGKVINTLLDNNAIVEDTYLVFVRIYCMSTEVPFKEFVVSI